MTSGKLSTMADSLVLFSSDDEESDSHYELKHYENLRAMLKGVPPPSSITISKFTIEEMLQKYHENKESFGFRLEANMENTSSSKNPVPFLNYLNSSSLSESLSALAQKVQGRYVQMETMSSYNTLVEANLDPWSGAKKRLGTNQGPSPGRRLSHLARRRQFFSSANLQRLANAENIRQIEIKKSSNRGVGRKRMTRTVESEKLKSSKRALFLSPENGTPTKYGNTVAIDRHIYSSGSEERRKQPLQERSKKVEVLKWLSQQNFEVDFPRKRLREECANHSFERKRKCPRRSLNFADDDASSNVATSDSNNSTDRRTLGSGKLSEIHKNKLLWATSVVLRENNITRKDEHFKNLAAKLFFNCRTSLDEILNLNTGEGTSDKILYFARKIIPSVFEELGIKPKISSENCDNCEKVKSNIGGESQYTDETKENINSCNINNLGQSSNNTDSKNEFVFKTPRKIQRKRIVKSCQKAPNSGSKKKKSCLRRWRSFELLIEDAVQSSMMNLVTDRVVAEEKKLASADVGNNFDDKESVNSIEANGKIIEDNTALCAVSGFPLLTSDVIKSDGFSVPTNEIPRLPSVDTSLVFSPIPSSVKEESEIILYPMLLVNQADEEETQIFSDENDSIEIINQDKDLAKRIDSPERDGTFSTEYEDAVQEENIGAIEDNTEVRENPVLLPPITNPQSLNETAGSSYSVAVNTNVETLNTGSLTHNDGTKTEESINTTELLVSSSKEFLGENISKLVEKEKNEDVKEENDFNPDTVWDSEDRRLLTSECGSTVEKGTYKPRKLVVKKSKPNWKVVRKNSDEADNEAELRLKMRLSHEWEIVCRNSFCSDIGNHSEHDTTSVNCSQTSSITDREISSEYEVENLSRRSSAQSNWDESIDEEIAKSNVSPENKDDIQADECNPNFTLNSSKSEEESDYNLTPKDTWIPAQLPKEDRVVQPDEVDNFVCRKESYGNTSSGCGNVVNVLHTEVYNPNITEYQRACIGQVETKSRNNKNEELSDKVKISTEKEYEEENDEKFPCEGSSLTLPEKRFGENLSKEGKIEKNCSILPEGGIEEEDYSICKRSRESETGQYDSESGHSSGSVGPYRKKRLLSLENYKARKMKEASKDMKSMVFNEESESKDVSSDEMVFESNVKKKIYNIRLKHPIGHHKGKRRHKHKEYSKEKKQKKKTRERVREKSDSVEDLEPEADGSSNSGSHLHSLHQFLDSFHETNPSGNAGDAKWNTRNQESAGNSDSNPKEVNIQTIVNALSALSNLVREQIKLENDKMTDPKESGENGLKKSKWFDVVSSWCHKNLGNLSQTHNASSLSIDGLDAGNMAAVTNVFDLGVSPPPESVSKTGNSVTTDEESVHCIDLRKNSSNKTERNAVQDCVRPSSTVQIRPAFNPTYDNAALVNGGRNSSQNNMISNCFSSIGNDSQNVMFQNFSMYSGMTLENSEALANTSECVNAFCESRGVSAVKDYTLSRGDIGKLNSEEKMDFNHFQLQQHKLKQAVKDPRCCGTYKSKSQRSDGSDGDYGGSLEFSDYGKLNSAYPSTCGEYSSSMQTPYQFPNNYLTTQKPSFFQPNVYSNFPGWQIPGDLNYHQNTARDAYQNSAFYPFQIPYYLNKY